MKTDKNRAQTVTQAVLNFTTRLGIFFTLARLDFPGEAHQQIADLVDQLRIANDDRNRLTHDEYYWGNFDAHEFGNLRVDPLDKNHKMWNWDVPTLNDLIHRLWELYVFLYWIEQDDARWQTEQLPALDKSPTQRLKLARQSQNNPNRRRIRRQAFQE